MSEVVPNTDAIDPDVVTIPARGLPGQLVDSDEDDNTIPHIPRHVVTRRIAKGGMGMVYEAINLLGVPVAVKVIHPKKRSIELMARFRDEARAMMQLNHPNLARIYDFGDTPSGPYLTMRLESGRTLMHLAPSLIADPILGLQTMLQVVDGVAYLHDRRKVHRDLKPSNVLLGENNEPIVSDFGLIKEVRGPEEIEQSQELQSTPVWGSLSTGTQTGIAVGTRAYMAPEQAAADREAIGPPADVYALGLMIAEFTWGTRPFAREDGVPVIPSTHESRVPSWARAPLRELVTRCLMPQPSDRFATAGELRDAIQAALTPPVLEPVDALKQPSRRWMLVAGSLGLAGIATGAAAMMRRRDSASRMTPLQALQNEVRDQGRADLLNEDGTWRFSEWRTPPSEWITGPPPDAAPDARGYFDAPLAGVRLLEVASGVTNCRLVAEIACVGPGEVGAFVGRSTHKLPSGRINCFLYATVLDFSLRPENGKNRGVRKIGARSCSEGPGGFFTAPVIEQRIVYIEPQSWAKVVLELTDTTFRCEIEGSPFKEVTRNQLLQTAGRALGQARQGAEGLTPTFQPAEGLGFFASHSRIAVRSAYLELTSNE